MADDATPATPAAPAAQAADATPSVQVAYVLTPDDLLEASLARTQTAREMERVVRRVRVVGVLLVALAIVVVMLFWLLGRGPFGIAIGLVLFVGGLVYIVRARPMMFGRTRKLNSRIYHERWTPPMSAPRTLTIAADGISARSEFAQSHIAWAAVSEVQRTAAGVILWLGVDGTLVPTRAFANAESAEYFARLAEYYRLAAPTHL